MNSILILALFCFIHVNVEATIGFLRGKGSGGGSGRGLFGSLKGESGGGGDSGNNDGRGLFGKFKGNGEGGGLFKAGRGKGKGLLGGLGGGILSGDDGNQFPDFPGLNNADEQQSQGHANKGKGRGKGKGKLNIFSRLNEDLPCASSLSTLPILEKLPGIPSSRFPSFLPTGVNTCDETCGGKDTSTCTYNWRDSLIRVPFLLFRCVCKNQCPPKKINFGRYLKIDCDNVSNEKSRCNKCPYGQDSFKCTYNLLPVLKQQNPYYCACCNTENGGGDVLGLGGYGGGGYEGGIVSQQQSFDITSSNDQGDGGYSDNQTNNGNDFENSGVSGAGTVGGYADYTDAKSNSNAGTNMGGSEAASEVNGQKFVGGFLPVSGSSITASGSHTSNIKPLGSEFMYDHLK